MMKFTITTQSREQVTVNGELVTIPGYEEYEFVLHHSILKRPRDEQKWSVSERSTSGWLTYGRTKKEAIANAALELSKYTKEQTKAALQRVSERILQ